jgi:dihydrofolate reductase
VKRVIAGLMMSLDGVVEAPETWTGPYFSPDLGQVVGSLMAASDTMLLGRVTYQTFEGAFAQAGADNPMAAQMNSIAKVVVSTTLQSATWANSTLISADIRAKVTALKEGQGKDVIVSGSPTLVRWLLAEDLLDQLDLLMFPVVRTEGRRLFDGFGDPKDFKLARLEEFSRGVVHAVYQPA